MAPYSLKRTVQLYRTLMAQLEAQINKLTQRRRQAELRAYVVVDSDLEAEQSPYHTEANSLLLASIEKQLEITKIKVDRVTEVLCILQEFSKDSQQPPPTQLSYDSFEEWVTRNKVLQSLNESLYEIEELKYALLKRRKILKDHFVSKIPSKEALVQNIGSLLSKLDNAASYVPQSTLSRYLDNLLLPHEEGSTIESQQVSSYVEECHQVTDSLQSPDDNHGKVVGVHPQRYHEVVEILSNFILQKEIETQQDESLTQEEVFLAIERAIMPQIKQKVIKSIESPVEDQWLYQQCIRYADITLDQLSVAKRLQSDELVPFAQAIACLQSSFFATNPTTKVLSVLSAAKALYICLQQMGQATNLDADSFLDIWIYVVIKAGLQDLVTVLAFMSEYSNPQLCYNEAGYYLTTLQVAIQFISRLKPEMLQQRIASLCVSTATEFITCEQKKIANQKCYFKVLERDKILTGYKIGIIKDWALQPWRLYCSVLIRTGSNKDSAKVTVFSVCDTASYSQFSFVRQQYCCLQEIPLQMFTETTPLGQALVINKDDADTSKIKILSEGNFDVHYPLICHEIQLIRLGSEKVDHEASCMLSEFNSPGSNTRDRDTKLAGNKIVVEAEVHHENQPQLLDSKRAGNRSKSCLNAKKPEEIELLHCAQNPNQDNNAMFLTGSLPSLRSGTPQTGTLSIPQLELNFLWNYYSRHVDNHNNIHVAVNTRIKEAQIYLQRLGYLSHAIQADGIYTDFVLEAVKKFQRDYIEQSATEKLDVSLPTNGYLTVQTFVCLASRYLNIHHALIRRGGVVPDVMLADKESLALFRACVRQYQERVILKNYTPGYLCGKTTAKLLNYTEQLPGLSFSL